MKLLKPVIGTHNRLLILNVWAADNELSCSEI